MKHAAKKFAILAVLVAVAILLIVAVIRREARPVALSKAAQAHIEALDDALKNGMISRREYDSRVAQIRAGSNSEADGETSDPADAGSENRPSIAPAASDSRTDSSGPSTVPAKDPKSSSPPERANAH